VRDWAEVHRLCERERLSKSAIAKRLGMSRPTVIRLLGLDEPPRYQRESPGSKLDPYKHAIAAMLDADSQVAATVILEHLRRDGYAGASPSSRSMWPAFVRRSWRPAATSAPATCLGSSLTGTGGSRARRSQWVTAPPARRTAG